MVGWSVVSGQCRLGRAGVARSGISDVARLAGEKSGWTMSDVRMAERTIV
jgi:hypothetical protein